MSGTSLALKIGSLVLGLGAYLVLFKKVKGLKKYGITSLLYLLLISIILGSCSFLLLFQPALGEIRALLIAQLIIVAIGTGYLFIAPEILPWYRDQPFSMQLVFIIALLLFGYFFSNLVFTFWADSTIQMVWQLSLLWFLVPVLLNQTILKLLEVPPKEFKQWTYPLNQTIPDPTDAEMENPVVISFEFKKSCDSEQATTFRAKAPVGMSLGRLFYFFINDYNSRHPEETICYTDKPNHPCQWIFFKMRNRVFDLKTALDPEDSIYNSNIKENDILVCKRVNSNENPEEK
jgi:hypothetical protein